MGRAPLVSGRASAFAALRVDLSGLGESPLRHLNQDRFIARAPEAFTDIADIARAVSPADPRRIVLVGLCSSGYQAIDSALDLQSLGLVAINPMLRFVPPEAEQGLTLDPRRRAALPCKPATVALGGTALLALRARFPGVRRVSGCGPSRIISHRGSLNE